LTTFILLLSPSGFLSLFFFQMRSRQAGYYLQKYIYNRPVAVLVILFPFPLVCHLSSVCHHCHWSVTLLDGPPLVCHPSCMIYLFIDLLPVHWSVILLGGLAPVSVIQTLCQFFVFFHVTALFISVRNRRDKKSSLTLFVWHRDPSY
jgi:hypothetical protein